MKATEQCLPVILLNMQYNLIPTFAYNVKMEPSRRKNFHMVLFFSVFCLLQLLP